jgi:hypothetical protein
MADIEAIEVLTQAKERLFECGWAKCSKPSRPNKPEVCLEEALLPPGFAHPFVSCLSRSDHAHDPYRRAVHYVRAVLGSWNPPDYIRAATTATPLERFNLFMWNDLQKSATPVFDVLDNAIMLAKDVDVVPA